MRASRWGQCQKGVAVGLGEVQAAGECSAQHGHACWKLLKQRTRRFFVHGRENFGAPACVSSRSCLVCPAPHPSALMAPLPQLGEDRPFLEILPDVIKSYGMSLQHGSEHCSQSLPRMLTLWFEFGTYLHTFRKGQASAPFWVPAFGVFWVHGGHAARLSVV